MANATPQEPTELRLRWSHESADEAWVPRTVSLGNNGQTVFTRVHEHSGTGFTRLFSAYDQNPPAPLTQGGNSGQVVYSQVDSSSRSDVHVSFSVEGSSPYTAFVRKYSSSGMGWSYQFPFQSGTDGAVKVSADGQTIAAWYAYGSSARVAIFTPSSSTPQTYVELSTYGTVTKTILSEDGDVLFLCSSARTTAIDTATGNVIDRFGYIPTTNVGHAANADGTVVARVQSAREAHVYRRDGNDFVRELTYSVEWPETLSHMALTPSGDHLAFTTSNATDFSEVRIVIIDTHTGSVLMEDFVDGAQGAPNNANDMEFSADGHTLVVGTAGDNAGEPEARVYGLTGDTWELTGLFDVAGSIFDVDVSPDGKTVAVARKLGHQNAGSYDGAIEVIEIGRELLVAGIPTSGSQVTVQVKTRPSRQSFLLSAATLSSQPEPMGSAGLLMLPRQALTIAEMGSADEQGVATCNFVIPDDPSLIGTSVYFQGFSASPRRLTRDAVSVTILP